MLAVSAPTTLKGVLGAREAARAVAEGLRPFGLDVDEAPIADGGDGTADVLAAALGGEWREAGVHDALGRPVTARWLQLPDGTAVVEAAEAVGLQWLAPGELDPWAASSRGLGELILAAARGRTRSLLVCLGGTATMEGGAGLREMVSELPCQTTALYDVRTTLLDAPRLFGPQKGASAELIPKLVARLASMPELEPVTGLPGSGAAGGLGAALAALGANLRPGADYVFERIHFRDRIRRAALVVTGEGVVDATTLEGKAPGRAAEICRDESVRCAVFGGKVIEPLPGAEMHELSGDPELAGEDLVALGRGLGRELCQ